MSGLVSLPSFFTTR